MDEDMIIALILLIALAIVLCKKLRDNIIRSFDQYLISKQERNKNERN